MDRLKSARISDFSHAMARAGPDWVWGITFVLEVSVSNVCVSRLQIGDTPNRELRIITSAFSRVQYKGESVLIYLIYASIVIKNTHRDILEILLGVLIVRLISVNLAILSYLITPKINIHMLTGLK